MDNLFRVSKYRKSVLREGVTNEIKYRYIAANQYQERVLIYAEAESTIFSFWNTRALGKILQEKETFP